jgi:predicted DNA-binding transcriptional regulator AlpA
MINLHLAGAFRLGQEMPMTLEFIDTDELARRTNTAAITWAKRRMRGGADTPPYVKIGRCVRYRWRDVEAWLAAQERGSTSEAA